MARLTKEQKSFVKAGFTVERDGYQVQIRGATFTVYRKLFCIGWYFSQKPASWLKELSSLETQANHGGQTGNVLSFLNSILCVDAS